jgi:uncharacterized GH25 family protein
MRRAIFLALLSAGLLSDPVQAHFNMLLPETSSVKKGNQVTLVYQWGHPFEHQLFDAPAPQSVFVFAPDGKKTDLTKTLTPITLPGADNKMVTAYRFRFTPEQRGDYTFVLNTPPIWMDEDQEFLQDTVKVVLHVQAQKGWDAVTGQDFEMVSLTRPYGLLPGMVFQAKVNDKARADLGGKAGSDLLVEVERYNPTPPKELPPDEFITRTAKTDPNGVATCTLTEAGWWSITAQKQSGKKERNGNTYPVRQRTTLWVFVDEKPSAKADK